MFSTQTTLCTYMYKDKACKGMHACMNREASEKHQYNIAIVAVVYTTLLTESKFHKNLEAIEPTCLAFGFYDMASWVSISHLV